MCKRNIHIGKIKICLIKIQAFLRLLLEKINDRTKHAMAIAEFGLLLRDSNYKMDASFSNVEALLQEIETEKFMKGEVIELVGKAEKLYNVK